MKIGVILHDFALGGTERVATRLARHWAGRDMQVVIFCGSAEGPIRSFLGSNVRLIPADPPIRRGIGSRVRLGRAARRFFSGEPVDAIFIPGNFHWPLIPALARIADAAGPVIVAKVSSTMARPQRAFIARIIFRMATRHRLARADALVCLTEEARKLADAMLGRPVGVLIPNPALDDDDRPLSRAGGRMIVAAGRLEPVKGFDVLIKALALIRDPAVELSIVGAGPEEARLRTLIGRLRLTGRVTLVGLVPDIRPWLDRARLFVLSSRYEGVPAVLIEALNAGRPVVATDCTEAAHELLADPEVGRIVPVDDSFALAVAIAAMLDTPPPDPQRLAARVRCNRMSEAGEAYLELFARLRRQRRA